jgi:hypothetical protein
LNARTASGPPSTSRSASFAERAGPILDLYAGVWEGERLHPGEYVICADEKPSIPARRRAEGRARVPAQRRALLAGRMGHPARKDLRPCAPKDGIKSFDALVDQFMRQHPYRSAQRVFLIIDNGSAHRGKRSIDRLTGS